MHTLDKSGISRRTFLAGSAAAAAGLLLAQKGWVDAARFFGPDGVDIDGLERAGYLVRHTICHQCGAGCGLTALVKKGMPPGEDAMIILPSQAENHPQRGMCGRGATAPYTWNSPLRLRKPMKLVGPRGSGQFQEIGWDQALDEIAAKLTEIIAREGPRSVAITTHDFADEANWLAWPLGLPNVIGQGSTCNTHGIVARRWMMGPGFHHHAVVDPDYDNVRYVLFPGRSLNAPIGAVHRLAKAREHGAKAVFLNPAHPDVAFAAGEWLPCTPGTDAAFMLALAHVLVAEQRYDEAFVRDYTNLPFLLKDSGLPLTAADLAEGGEATAFAVHDASTGGIAFHKDAGVVPALVYQGTVTLADGTEAQVTTAWNRFLRHLEDYTPDKVAAITSVPARTIVRVARELHTMQGVVEDTWYNTRNGNDLEAVMALMTVNGLLGNFDRLGGLCFRPGARLPGVMSRDADGNIQTVTGGAWTQKGARRIDQEVYPETNGTFDAVLSGILDEQPYAIKALVLFGATLFHRDPNTQRIEAALRKAEFVVTLDVVHQEICDWSDYVLPTEMFLERDRLKGIGWTMTASVIKADKVTDPPADTDVRPNDWIMLELLRRMAPERAEALGYQASMQDLRVYKRDFLDPIETARIQGLAAAWNRDAGELRTQLHREGFVILQPQGYGRVPYRVPFTTPSGRLEIYALLPVQRGWREQGFAVHLDPPAYTLPKAQDEFYLVNGKSPIASSGIASLAFPTQYLADNAVWLNPADAERLGVKDGARIEVEGLDTGWKARAEARVTPRVHRGVAFTYSYVGGNRQKIFEQDPRFKRMAQGINPQWFSTAYVNAVTGAGNNNASVRIRRA